ncbi:hypothetical protein [Rhizomonospora bruguierae]|uniref:hypothetical protein n=1 Tax=Rhizomonospora bruguierae TaxID=1581705 RepID=UPI001BCBC016|nr:hypothetical protein [Micromonospora sp. NBRC 107566]
MNLPPPARAIAAAATAAVTAARDAEPDAYRTAGERLAALDQEQVNLVLGAVVRMLLEEQHPDGLDADDVQAVLDRCARAAAVWYPDLNATALMVLLVGALGVHPDNPAEVEVPEGAVVRHAPLLVADLLAATGAKLAPYLSAAFAEIARTETLELP